MDIKSFEKYVEKMFTYNTLPGIMDFIRIPNLSPNFDKEWNTNGLLLKAAYLITSFAKSLNLKNTEINILQDKGYSPAIFIDIKASRPNDNRTILFYAHFDKQPYGTGWDPDKSPIIPIIQDGKLYGRGAVDDGYASFSILTAIKACQDHNSLLPRVCCLFEGAEESTDEDLKYYFDKLIPIIGKNLIAFIPLDGGCGTYDRLWVTSSLRGVIEYQIEVQTLDSDFNYGPEVSGKVPENFFLIRKIFDGIMDNNSGDVLIEEMHLKEIPQDKLEQIDKEVEIIGDSFFDNIPLYSGVKPLKSSVKEVLINNRWKPTCTLYGMDNSPQISENGFKAKKSMRVSVGMRIPPGIDGEAACQAIQKKIKECNYFGAKVTADNFAIMNGWELKNFSEHLKNILNEGSKTFFGNEVVFRGEGGSIPFLTYFQTKYPDTDIICTGVNGIDGNEHGPNENLNLECCKKMILLLCHMLIEI